MTSAFLDRNSETPAGMVLIPAGEFLMGGDQGSEVEKPVHRVYVDAFFMDSTPVTNEQFETFVAATGYRTTAERLDTIVRAQDGDFHASGQSWRSCSTSERKRHPVVFVSWDDADAYSKWAGKRLPTEAEWEKAARGGIEQARFPWGNEVPTETMVNWNKTQDGSSGQLPPTDEVAAYPPNGLGLYDMVGNVWEWCLDWYSDTYYVVGPSSNPQGPERGQYRVRRGASWNVREDFRLRCSNRGAMPSNRFWPNLGFRCAVSLKEGE